MRIFLLFIGSYFYLSFAAANSFDDVKNYLFKNGFKYRDAYSGPVEQYRSVNQEWKNLGIKNNISKAEGMRLIQEDLENLNQAQELKQCSRNVLTRNFNRGYIVNLQRFLRNDDRLRASFKFEFYGTRPSCDDLKSCPSHRARLDRQYACSLQIDSRVSNMALHEIYFTLDYGTFIECENHIKEILEIDSNSFLFELFLSQDSVPHCAINILVRKN